MKRFLLSLHVTRWLRVVAVAGVVLTSVASVETAMDKADVTLSSLSTFTANAWCPRC